MFDLTGKQGIVTGASSGLGLAIANVLCEAGAKVYNFSRTAGLKDERAYCHPNVIHVAVDVCNFDTLQTHVDAVGKNGGIDFLINNAGTTKKALAQEFDINDFEYIQKVNVTSVFKLTGLCYPYLKQSAGKGRVVNIASMAAHLGFSQVVPYCASKGAVMAMTRGFAVEWATENVTVNSISPGWFPSGMSAAVVDEERRNKILNRIPFHEFGQPKDIGAMALFLLSDGAGYITGQDFAVDGGVLAFGF